MYFVIKTLGCKVNQYESDCISASMRTFGYIPSLFPDDYTKSDIVIINSCAVTENSVKKTKQMVRNARAGNNDILIVLTGCFPSAFRDCAEKLEADIVLGTSEKSALPQIVKNYIDSKTNNTYIDIKPAYRYDEFSDGQVQSSNTRAYIKIQDGCERFCSYCIIPKARGKVRSRGLSEIKKEAEILAAKHKELVLTGINLTCYGQEIGYTLIDAVNAAAASDAVRIRLSSLEPDFMTEDTIKRLSFVEKLCPHFHLSLQSGCDRTLKRMNRHYTVSEYTRIVESLRKNFKNCAVTTDIMVGFAGETDEEFSRTLRFVNETGFSKIHVFTYSKREGTVAAERTDHIHERIKAERHSVMCEAAKELEKRFFNYQKDTVHQVLIEKRTHEDFVFGHTANYLPVRIYGENAFRHELIKVKITDVKEKFCIGEKL